MIEKIKQWYQAVLSWFGTSEPGGRKETVEDQLTESVLKDLLERMWAQRLSSGKARFPQVLRGGLKPSDRDRLFNIGITVPSWGDISIDEWEGPEGKGCSINFWVTETDLTEWVLRVKWFPGAEGTNFRPSEMYWEEVQNEP